jgi:hypothetical protein
LSPILGIWASANQSQYIATNSYESIATVTVGSGGAANIEFTSIPATYTHLQLRGISRGVVAAADAALFIYFNSDTAASYSAHQLYSNGSAVGSNVYGGNPTSSTYIGTITGATATASIFGVAVIDILEYANTNIYKTVRALTGFDSNGSGKLDFKSLNWRSTSAITTIKIQADSNNLAQYSQFALYGIKGS